MSPAALTGLLRSTMRPPLQPRRPGCCCCWSLMQSPRFERRGRGKSASRADVWRLEGSAPCRGLAWVGGVGDVLRADELVAEVAGAPDGEDRACLALGGGEVAAALRVEQHHPPGVEDEFHVGADLRTALGGHAGDRLLIFSLMTREVLQSGVL